MPVEFSRPNRLRPLLAKLCEPKTQLPPFLHADNCPVKLVKNPSPATIVVASRSSYVANKCGNVHCSNTRCSRFGFLRLPLCGNFNEEFPAALCSLHDSAVKRYSETGSAVKRYSDTGSAVKSSSVFFVGLLLPHISGTNLKNI